MVQRVTVIYRADKCSSACTVAVQRVTISYKQTNVALPAVLWCKE